MDKRLQDALQKVEETMNFKPGNSEATTNALVKLAANGPSVPRIGTEAAEKMLHLSKTAAEDVRKLGDLAITAAEAIRDEAHQMAHDIEANGKTVANHLTGFAQLLADIGMSNRETHARLLRGEPSPNRAEEARRELEKVIEEEFVPEDPPHEPTV